MSAVQAAIGDVSDVQDLSSQITNKISAVISSNLYKIGKLCVLRFQIVGTFVQTEGVTLMTLPIQSKGPFDVCVTNYNNLSRLFTITSGAKNIKMYWGSGANAAVDHIVELVFISN